LSPGPHGEDREVGQEWVEIATDVRSVAVGDNAAWLVTNAGDIICYEGLDRKLGSLSSTVLPREWPVTKIACFGQVSPYSSLYVLHRASLEPVSEMTIHPAGHECRGGCLTRDRQHALHLCRAGCIISSDNPLFTATGLEIEVQFVF